MRIAIMILSVFMLSACESVPKLPDRIDRPIPWHLLVDCPDMPTDDIESEEGKIKWIADMADKYPKCAERFPQLREWFKAVEKK